ncbi:CidA/LrgA family protein [Pseudooceanicola sp. CBS1P-1]|uniref:CidA/LrgA family protein n=1 Tax=Pseudooceanicola albus TaxID=2692189 RepID=A0A6L7G2U5_9RHOB|nr:MULTISPECIES: CidA/LrgA family protein [Pseudooceanicola]MBT9384744.1 CidA/LrgA family protein [Pseudooceanicola endophyticus]MXN18445.1 CidA/LrgA family protein [Pseudooceanicola albus]
MIRHLFLLLLYQLIGESLARALNLPLPGPVLGMLLLFLTFLAAPQLYDAVRGTVTGLLSHLSLLFVPVGVGVVQYLGLMKQEGIELLIVLVVSTALAIAAGALAFHILLKITGQEERP